MYSLFACLQCDYIKVAMFIRGVNVNVQSSARFLCETR